MVPVNLYPKYELGTLFVMEPHRFNLYYGSGDGVPAGVQYHPATEDVAEAVNATPATLPSRNVFVDFDFFSVAKSRLPLFRSFTKSALRSTFK